MNNKPSGWGATIAFLLWAAILFLFSAWPGLPDVLMWIARVIGLLSLLVSVLGACTELAKGRKQ